MMRPADSDSLTAYRNDPEVARYQGWQLPYNASQASEMLADQADLDDVPPMGWVQLAVERNGVMIGDLAVALVADGHVAEVGYTFAAAHHGRGYATEALGGLVDRLFATSDVHRVVAHLDPANTPSLRVLERLGFVFEGLARRSELARGTWVDDLSYSLLREDRIAWVVERPDVTEVSLVELGPTTVGPFSRLAVHRSQEKFVAPMWASFRDALFPEEIDGSPVVPWMRGIVADGEPVGFMMLAAVTPTHPDPYLWRLLVDRRYQRRGVGDAALRQLVLHLRSEGCKRLLTSWVEGPGGPAPFYTRLGFRPTGRVIDGEVEAVVEFPTP
jgi:RimJ/RimL family protein N-acetyltransferase